MENIYQRPEEERTGDIVELKSGRILSRNTRPVCFEDGEIIGRLWDFEDITERTKQEDKIKYLAFNDALTGLPNRRTFYDRISVAIAEAKRNKLMFAVIFIDLVEFKEVNDTYGHEIGDKALKAVTEKMSMHLRESDTLARIGGDEFILLIPKINKKEDAQTVTEKFAETFQTPLLIDGHEISAGLSIGASFFSDDGEEPDTLIRKADEAMYKAKKTGRNNSINSVL